MGAITYGTPRSHSVSPVLVTLSLVTAPMPPAGMAVTGVCSLPRRENSWPTRSSTSLFTFSTRESDVIVPENTRR